MTSPIKVAIYARVSTANKDQNPDVQVQELNRYCSARDWKITETIVDHGYSGGTENRPGLKKLRALVQARSVDAVVVVKLDRLFRSLKHLVTTLEEFQALGVQFVATKDQIDYTTPSGRLFVQMLGCLGEFEKALLRERTLLGLEYARSKGKRLGRPKKRNDEAIRALRAQGKSYSEIQRALGCERTAVYRALRAIAKTHTRAEFQVSEKKRHQKA